MSTIENARPRDSFVNTVPCWMHKHVFEHAGLGVAPFAFVRVEIRKYQACEGAPVQPGGSCQYCGEGIMECCFIRDSQGKEFMVGNVCVGKTGDDRLYQPVKKAINRVHTEQRHKRELQRIEAARELLKRDDLRAILASRPHPYSDLAAKGLTELSWAEWMMAHAGNAGQMCVAKTLEALERAA
jgi:hypothetical protein